MKMLITELITRHPEIWARLEDDPGLPFLLQGVFFLRRGALMAGLEILGVLPEVRRGQVAVLRALVAEEHLVNAAAELSHRFGASDGNPTVPLLLGAALGERAEEVAGFHRRATSFLTRVVGVNHEGRLFHLQHLHEGERLYLIREKDNPHDPNAIRVLDTLGDTLGYLRRTLAAILAPQVDQGQPLAAEVACLLGEEFRPDLRLNIKVTRMVASFSGTVICLMEPGLEMVREPEAGDVRR